MTVISFGSFDTELDIDTDAVVLPAHLEALPGTPGTPAGWTQIGDGTSKPTGAVNVSSEPEVAANTTEPAPAAASQEVVKPASADEKKPPPAPKSWAEKVKAGAWAAGPPDQARAAVPSPTRSPTCSAASPAQAAAASPRSRSASGAGELAEDFSLVTVDSAGVEIVGPGGLSLTAPRGIYNKGNTCYIGSCLQALLWTPQFCSLMDTLSKVTNTDKSPVLKAFREFYIGYAATDDDQQSKIVDGIKLRPPVQPTVFLSLLGSQMIAGRQEDAHEFLQYVLDGLHEELIMLSGASSDSRVTNGVEKHEGPAEDDDGWQEIGRNHSRYTVARHLIVESSVTKIFGGQLRSSVRSEGSRPSVTFQPFIYLSLDVASDSIRSVDDALVHYMSPEILDDFTCSKTKTEVRAEKHTTIGVTPEVLIVQLNRFAYDMRGNVQKVTRRIQYGVTLDMKRHMDPDSFRRGDRSTKYRLRAVISHHGKAAAGGHYTCDVSVPEGVLEGHGTARAQWLRFDDSVIKPITESVALDSPAYLLFYSRVEDA